MITVGPTSNNPGSPGTDPAVAAAIAELRGRRSRFCIFAEESGNLTEMSNGGYGFSFGNGAVLSSSRGVITADECELFGIGLSTTSSGSSAGVNVEICPVRSGIDIDETFVLQGANDGFWELGNPVPYASGDTVNARVLSATGTGPGARVSLWFREAWQ